MTDLSLHFFQQDKEQATRLAASLEITAYEITVHTFPDGESRVKVAPVKGTAIIYASLTQPNATLIQLAFAASALVEFGASRLVLVAPYLCYMRQDKAFEEGEAISQQVIARYLSVYFDRLITVDPHLHRIRKLQTIFSGCAAESLSAAALIAASLRGGELDGERLLVGPDAESEQWVSSIAEKVNLPFIVGQKIRHGDRNVEVTLPENINLQGKRAIIIDDMISSGGTISRCAEALLSSGASMVEVVAVHVLSNAQEIEAMGKSGISRIRSTDSVPHSTNTISLTPLLVNALEKER